MIACVRACGSGRPRGSRGGPLRRCVAWVSHLAVVYNGQTSKISSVFRGEGCVFVPVIAPIDRFASRLAPTANATRRAPRTRHPVRIRFGGWRVCTGKCWLTSGLSSHAARRSISACNSSTVVDMAAAAIAAVLRMVSIGAGRAGGRWAFYGDHEIALVASPCKPSAPKLRRWIIPAGRCASSDLSVALLRGSSSVRAMFVPWSSFHRTGVYRTYALTFAGVCVCGVKSSSHTHIKT